MCHPERPRSRISGGPPRGPARGRRAAGGLLLLGLTACGGGGGGADKEAATAAGKVVEQPDGTFFIADPNQNGNAQEPRITRVMFGRLVQVFGLDAAGMRVPMAEDFPIADSLIADGQDYALEQNPVTSRELLTILRDVTDESAGGGRQQFFQLLLAAEKNLTPLFEKGPDGAGLYSMVPRNAALIVQFDDLIDEKTVTDITFRVRTGTPPVTPFEGRRFVDRYHGDLSDHGQEEGAELYSTRIVFDTTVSEIESFTNDPPLPVNGIGLPPSVDVNLANLEVRIPTKLHIGSGQTELLRNPSGHAITAKDNGPVDQGSPTKDVLRAARSGGPGEVTGDPANGFLVDGEPPQLIGLQLARIDFAPLPLEGPAEFLLPELAFESLFCAQTPRPGDVIAQSGVFAEVIQSPIPVQDGVVKDLKVRLVLYPVDWDLPGKAGPGEWVTSAVGDAEFRAAFDPVDDAGRQGCFLRVEPRPEGYPDHPVAGLSPSSLLALQFSEPMDPASLTAFDSLTLTRQPANPGNDPPLPTSAYVVGSVGQSLDLRDFSFVPDLPLAHAIGDAESYYLRLAPGVDGPTDLAGNPLAFQLPEVECTLDPGASTQKNGGRVSRFRGQDEEPPIGDEESGPLPEWSGQHLYDTARELIRPRPATRFLALADTSHPVPKLMKPFASGVQTPLSGLGSKLHMVWRYLDFGFSLTNTTQHNVDIEGLYWSPATGGVNTDHYPEFEISLAHGAYLPDEYLNPVSNLPKFPLSGLEVVYQKNFLDLAEDPPKVVHPRALGYHVNPGDAMIAPSGTKLMPFPLNRNVPPTEWRTWTWRDTGVRARAGEDGGGADPWQLYFALGKVKPSNQYYPPGKIQTVGLPLLTEIRCYPDDAAVGQNAFAISLASNAASDPNFRAFSTGGVNKNGKVQPVDPDLETKANGGFNPTSNPPGKKTSGIDNSFYIGAADMVARVSRSHSIWFTADDPVGGGIFDFPTYTPPTLEPGHEDQPDGTRITLAFRGLTAFDPVTDACDGSLVVDPIEDATTIDLYGDHYNDKCIPQPDGQPFHSTLVVNLGMTFLHADDTWKEDTSEIDGSSYYQIRVTFEADVHTGLVPELSALALSWMGQ